MLKSKYLLEKLWSKIKTIKIILVLWNKSVKDIFLKLKIQFLIIPHVLFDLQNESYKMWKTTIIVTISLQKELMYNSKFNFVVPAPFKIFLENMSEEITKYRLMCNKIIIATIDSGKKNVKTWNDNTDIFLDLNKKTVHFWLPVFNQKSVCD